MLYWFYLLAVSIKHHTKFNTYLFSLSSCLLESGAAPGCLLREGKMPCNFLGGGGGGEGDLWHFLLLTSTNFPQKNYNGGGGLFQNKEKNKLPQIRPQLSQLNVATAHRSYFSQNNLRILNWQHMNRLKITILVQIGNFLDWNELPNVHILFCLYKTWSFT